MYIVYESRRGRAHRAAEAVAVAAASHGVATLIRSLDDAVPEDIAEAPALLLGCCTEVDTPFGGEPVQRTLAWIEGLPDLHGKPIGLFCTYTFFPHTFADTAARTAEVLSQPGQAIELKGGKVVSSHSIHHKAFEKRAEVLVDEILEHTGG